MKNIYLLFLIVVTALAVSCNAPQSDATQKEEAPTTETTEKKANNPVDLMIQRLNETITLDKEQEDEIRSLGEGYDFSLDDPNVRRQKRKEFTQMVMEQVLTEEQKTKMDEARKSKRGEND